MCKQTYDQIATRKFTILLQLIVQKGPCPCFCFVLQAYTRKFNSRIYCNFAKAGSEQKSRKKTRKRNEAQTICVVIIVSMEHLWLQNSFNQGKINTCCKDIRAKIRAKIKSKGLTRAYLGIIHVVCIQCIALQRPKSKGLTST